MLAGKRERHQSGAGRQNAVAELPRHFVAEAGGTHAGDRQAAAGDNQRGGGIAAFAGMQAEAVVHGLYALDTDT